MDEARTTTYVALTFGSHIATVISLIIGFPIYASTIMTLVFITAALWAVLKE